MKQIKQFQGEFSFLSNFYDSPFKAGRVTWPTVEHFFQAMKTTDPKMREKIRLMTYPGDAKRAGRRLVLRPDWDDIKLDVMEYALMNKFYYNSSLAYKLVDTNPAQLIEGNYWHDTYWGVDLNTGLGQNHLGRLLMQIRTAHMG